MITVLTASLPERAEQLADAIESVEAQTLTAHEHKVWLDDAREGPAACRNRLLAKTGSEFVAFLDDDDVLYPQHLEVLAIAQNETDADLVFSWHDGGPGVPRYESWDASAYWTITNGRNVIPVTVLARTAAIREAGCFDPADRYEDHALFLRMLALGMTFVCVPQVTWWYRINGDGRTYAP